jgi:hypothetical protein
MKTFCNVLEAFARGFKGFGHDPEHPEHEDPKSSDKGPSKSRD